MVAGIWSVQLGGAVAVHLLDDVGVLGSVTVRLVLAALLLLALARPSLRGRDGGDWATVAGFGVVLAGMNTAFYGSLDRLPIGVAVTVEFTGPLVLAAVSSRRARDLLAVLAALVGVVLICEVLTVPWGSLDLAGIGLAATAGACWAAYILLSARAGSRFAGLDGIALSMVVGALVVAPFGIGAAGRGVLDPQVLVLGLGVAVLSSALPYSLELVALRTLAARVFGILLSLEPAAAALAGLLVLGQQLDLVQLVGMACVVLAGTLVLGGGGGAPPEALGPPDREGSIGSDPGASGTMTR